MGNESNCGLETVYINSKISDELLLNLINNLTELLILIYICINVIHCEIRDKQWKRCQISIVEFKRNTTVCHGNRCIQKIQFIDPFSNNPFLSMKIPKICHSSCSCLGININIAKCIVFDAVNKTCKQCKCKTKLHSQNYFKTSSGTSDINKQQVRQEKQIVINVLATFNFFKKQNQEVLSSEDIFNKYLDIQEVRSKTIFDRFNRELNQKVEEIETASLPITNKDVMVSINSLYEIKEGATIIPKFMEKIFPKDFQFNIVANTSSTLNKKTKTKASVVDEKKEMEMFKNRVIKLEHMMYNILSLNKNIVTEENGNDLSIQLRQEAASTSNVNLNQSEKETEGKEMNWNIDAK